MPRDWNMGNVVSGCDTHRIVDIFACQWKTVAADPRWSPISAYTQRSSRTCGQGIKLKSFSKNRASRKEDSSPVGCKLSALGEASANANIR